MRYLLPVFAMLFFSCQSQEQQPPVSKEKMEQLVLDLHIAEVYASVSRDSAHSVSVKNMDSLAVYYKDILRHHNITPDQYTAIVDWYKINPQELDSVYAKVIPRLTELETKYTNGK